MSVGIEVFTKNTVCAPYEALPNLALQPTALAAASLRRELGDYAARAVRVRFQRQIAP